jgi:hypothetical protein
MDHKSQPCDHCTAATRKSCPFCDGSGRAYREYRAGDEWTWHAIWILVILGVVLAAYYGKP